MWLPKAENEPNVQTIVLSEWLVRERPYTWKTFKYTRTLRERNTECEFPIMRSRREDRYIAYQYN